MIGSDRDVFPDRVGRAGVGDGGRGATSLGPAATQWLAARQFVNQLAKVFGWGAVWLMGTTLVASRSVAAEDVWLRVSTPDFTVITSAREKEAVAWTKDFAQFVAALREYFNKGKTRLPPLTMVVFGRERDFQKFHPLGDDGKPKEVGGFFQRHESWAVAGLASTSFGAAGVRHTIFHEGTHWFLSLQERSDPVWLEEGLAEVFSTFRVVGKEAEWGSALDGHVAFLNQNQPLPLAELLATRRGEVFGDDSNRTSVFYAESWAFVHYAIFGKHRMPRNALIDYAKFVQAGTPVADAFRRAFGTTTEEMDWVLGNYLHAGDYFVNRRPLAEVAELKTVPATAVDVADALGRLALGGGRWDLAVTQARAAIAAAPDDPRGHEVLAMALKERGEAAESLVEFGRAVEHGSRDYQPYFEMAAAAHGAYVGGPVAVNLAPAEARKVANQYERAINLHPRFLPSYQNLAGVIGLAEPVSPQDRRFLEQGLRLYPDDLLVKIGLATLTRRDGDHAAASARLKQLIAAGAGSASARAFAGRLDEAWELQDTNQQIAQLTKEKKFTEALALVDAWLARGATMAARAELTTIRGQLRGWILYSTIQQALDEKRWPDARRLLDEMAASDAPALVKLQTQRSLDSRDESVRRQLGRDAEAKK